MAENNEHPKCELCHETMRWRLDGWDCITNDKENRQCNGRIWIGSETLVWVKEYRSMLELRFTSLLQIK